MTGAPQSGLAARIGRREVLFGGLAASASLVASARAPVARAAVPPAGWLAGLMPERVAGWRALPSADVVLPPADTLRDRLYDDLATRVFTNPGGQAIMVLLAYKAAQDGMVQLHRPEVCYPASGFTLAEGQPLDLRVAGRTVPGMRFVARRGPRCEQLAYFTRIGTAFPRSWAGQRWAVLGANLAGTIPDGLLLRVSVLDPDPNRAVPGLVRFVAALAEAGSPAFRRLLTGAPT